MTKKVNWMITDSNITVNYDGQTHIVARTDGLADRLIKAVKEQRLDEIPKLVSASKRIEAFSHGKFVVQDGKILINGVEAPPVLGNKIVRFSSEGLPYQPLVKFAEKLQQNPSFRAVQELFQFLEKNDHPITENGNFIAYKRVKENFKDIYTGTMDNSIGTVVTMPRNQVNEDSMQTCSHGLHVANWDYAHTQFGSEQRETDIMLEVEVDPSDVVAIPADYDQSKMRVCKYVVLNVIDREHSSDVQLRRTRQDDNSEPNANHSTTNTRYFCIDCSREVDDGDDGYERCSECEEGNMLHCDYCGAEVFDDHILCEECRLDEEKELEKEEDCYPWEDELV